jgi:hypothetical protein
MSKFATLRRNAKGNKAEAHLPTLMPLETAKSVYKKAT